MTRAIKCLIILSVLGCVTFKKGDLKGYKGKDPIFPVTEVTHNGATIVDDTLVLSGCGNNPPHAGFIVCRVPTGAKTSRYPITIHYPNNRGASGYVVVDTDGNFRASGVTDKNQFEVGWDQILNRDVFPSSEREIFGVLAYHETPEKERIFAEAIIMLRILPREYTSLNNLRHHPFLVWSHVVPFYDQQYLVQYTSSMRSSVVRVK